MGPLNLDETIEVSCKDVFSNDKGKRRTARYLLIRNRTQFTEVKSNGSLFPEWKR